MTMDTWMVLPVGLMAASVALLVPPSAGVRLTPLLQKGRTRSNAWQLVRRRCRQVPFGPRMRRHRRQGRVATIEALSAFAAELVAGVPLSQALRRSGPQQWPLAIGALDRGGSPHDVARALGLDAQRSPLLRPLAAAWALAVVSGMSMAPMVEGVAGWARAQEDVRDELHAQLAGPRATGRMLAGLPLFGIVIGLALGADPLAWLFGTPLGLVCLVGGLACTGCGLAWMGALSRRVERQL